MTEETPSVKIKGVGNSLWVTVSPDVSFDMATSELARLFEPLKHLAGSTRVVLDTGDCQDNDDRHHQISTYLKDAFNLQEITTPQEKQSSEEKRVRMNNPRNTLSQSYSDTLVLAGRVRSGQTVQAKKHLVIIGDVNPGCELIAGGDILVLEVCPEWRPQASPLAIPKPSFWPSIFRPIQVKIGDVVVAGYRLQGEGKPEFAHVEERRHRRGRLFVGQSVQAYSVACHSIK